MLRNTDQTFGSMARLLHWVMGLAIIGMLGVGLWMVDLPNGDDKWVWYGLHKSMGVTILMVLLFRIYWRLTNPTPKLPGGLPQFIDWASRQNIRLLYLLMLLMPVSGMAMSLMGGHPISVFSLFTIPALSQGGTAIGKLGGLAHTYVAYTMIAALVLHIGAALLHHFFFKDNVLRRIISGN